MLASDGDTARLQRRTRDRRGDGIVGVSDVSADVLQSPVARLARDPE